MLKGKICLVTGGTKGIGAAIVKEFLSKGAIVYVNGRDLHQMEEFVESIDEVYRTRLKSVLFDVTDKAAAFDAIKVIKKEFGRLDVLVNNAGIVSYEFLPMVDMEAFRKMLDINVIGSIQMMQLALKLMGRQQNGSIINISSLVATRGASGQLAYAASKGAIISATKSAAKEFSNRNIRVNALAPGMVSTDRLVNMMEEKFKDQQDKIGFKRLAKPMEIANACAFFASDDSSYITGQVLEIEGSTVL